MVAVLCTVAFVVAEQQQQQQKQLNKKWVAPRDRCTSIGVTAGASLDGSTMTTHTNDCADCDFRIGVVPGGKTKRAQRPVAPARFVYPRYIGDDRGPTFLPENVFDKQFPWPATKPAGFIPEAEHRYSYVDGSYALINEHQVGFGESTCSARLVNVPIFDGGKALFDISDLSRIALERAKTAREAIQIMGALGEKYGYYGAEWKGPDAYGEAGESLTVADPKEVWIFHMLPDDTGAGAIWAAQRVPDGHVAVVANEFVIKEINLDDTENFMASSNVHSVAIRNKFWDPSQGPFNFRKTYMYSPFHVHQEYADRRNWRVFSLIAPSKGFTPNMTLDDLPFSVAPDHKLSVRDVFRLNRDHYEGTQFDLTKGVAAGPFGNPNRYDGGWASGVPIDLLIAGNFERAISIHRTAYSTVTQSRSWLPNVVGGKVWFGNAQPHATCYTPVYGAALDVAPEFQRGSLYKWDGLSSWWGASAVGNWMEKSYMHISEDVRYEQYVHEINLLKEAASFEAEVALIAAQDPVNARNRVTQYTVEVGKRLSKEWYDLFYFLVAKYKDGARIEDFHSEVFEANPLFYPFDWLKHTNYWENANVTLPESVPEAAVKVTPMTPSTLEKLPGVVAAAESTAAPARAAAPAHLENNGGVAHMAVGALVLAGVYAFGIFTGRRMVAKHDYTSL